VTILVVFEESSPLAAICFEFRSVFSVLIRPEVCKSVNVIARRGEDIMSSV
jgi:hypothetical protein